MTFSKKKNINTKYNSGVALTAVPLVNRKMTEKKNAELHNVRSRVEAQLNNFYNFCVN